MVEQNRTDRYLSYIAIASMLVGAVILFGFAVITVFRYDLSFQYASDVTGQAGDFVGGIVGTLFTLAGTVLIYSTLRLQGREQIRAHKESLNQNAFGLSTKLIIDINIRIDNVQYLSYRGSEALELLVRKFCEESDAHIHRAALGKREDDFPLHDGRFYIIESIYKKLEAAFLFIERPGVDETILLSLSVDLDDTLDRLRNLNLEIYRAKLIVERYAPFIKNEDESLGWFSYKIIIDFIYEKHKQLKERLYSIHTAALPALYRGNENLLRSRAYD